MLGVDDGVRVTVDGKHVFSRDEARPVREDDDVIPLDLAEGDHKIVLKLHQRDGAWAFRARLVDYALEAAPGAWLSLPGTTVDDAKTLATKMSWVSLDRSFDASSEPPRYRPKVTVRFPEGAPRGVPLTVTSRLENGFEVSAGAVPITSSGVSELVVALPPVPVNTPSRCRSVSSAARSQVKVSAKARAATPSDSTSGREPARRRIAAAIALTSPCGTR
jgi:hypothetical protein